MLIVCLSIVITSNVNTSTNTKKKHSQQKRKELLRKVQNFSEGQKQAKQKEIIRDYTNFKKQSQKNTDELKLQLSKNLNNLEDPKARAMASKLSKMKKTARNNDNEFLIHIFYHHQNNQQSRQVDGEDLYIFHSLHTFCIIKYYVPELVFLQFSPLA